MKATLEFDLPEEEDEHLLALNGSKWMLALLEMDNWLRTKIKYEDVESIKTEEIREKLYQCVEEYGLTLH